MGRVVLLVIALAAPLGPARAQFNVDPSVGIWINAAEIARLPISGDAWDDILAAANAPCETPDLTDRDNNADPCILAKAIVSTRFFALSSQSPPGQIMRDEVLAGLAQMMDEANWCENGQCCEVPEPSCTRKTLAVGRNLGPYLAAADLIGIGPDDTPSRADLIAFLEGSGDPADPEEIRQGILNYPWIDAGTAASPSVRRRLRDTHDQRPNNWGGHACASLAAAAIFRENAAELLQVRDVFLGWLGDCSQGDCSSFVFGAEAADWTCDQTPPEYGVNEEAGCRVNVSQTSQPNRIDFSGVQVDDMRRAGPFPAGCDSWPNACVADVHIWEGLQGRIACAHILRRQQLDVYQAADAALYRSFAFQHRPIWEIAGVPGQPHPAWISQDGTSNDDSFLTYIMNYAYGSSFPLDPNADGPDPGRDFGKGFGWTRYTLGLNPCSRLELDPDFDGTCNPIYHVPALPGWGLALVGALLAGAGARRLARGPGAQARCGSATRTIRESSEPCSWGTRRPAAPASAKTNQK